MGIEIVKKGFPIKPINEPAKSITGILDGREVITVSNSIMGQWHVGSSTCLPSNIEQAKRMLEVYVKVFDELEQSK